LLSLVPAAPARAGQRESPHSADRRLEPPPSIVMIEPVV
jgi:hypothetical protein